MAHNSASDAVEEFLKDFLKEQMRWKALAYTTKRICQEELGIQGIMAHFEFRVKTYESLKKKVERCNASRGGYNSKREIHDDICDRAGVRIVVRTPIQKQKVDIIIRETFEIIKVIQHPVEKVIYRGHIGVGYHPRDYKPVFPGYSGTHYHVQLRQENKIMYGMNYTADDIIEIQVSSTFLSSWQEADHDIRYKPVAGSPSLTEYKILDSINGTAQALDILMDEHDKWLEKEIAVNEGFQDEVGLAAFLDKWPSQFPRKSDFGNAPEVALFKLLKIYKMHNPVDLQTELENMHFQEGADIRAKLMVRKFEPFELGLSIHIIDHLLSTKGEKYSAAKEAEERYGEDGYKIRVMLSVIIWLDEFLPALRWEEKLFKHDRTPEQNMALNWFINGTNRFISILLGRKARLLDEDKTKVDILWAWFEDHQEEVVRFVWRLAKMGVLKDFPQQLLQFSRVCLSVKNLFTLPRLRNGTSISRDIQSTKPSSLSEGTLISQETQSTKPSTLSDLRSSTSYPKHIAMQEASKIKRQLLPEIEENLEGAEVATILDDRSVLSIDSVAALNPRQKRDIVRRFARGLLKELESRHFSLDEPNFSRKRFQKPFLNLLKEYSEAVKSGTIEKSKRQAAKQIRIFRKEIGDWCQADFERIGFVEPGRRVYPGIVKELEKNSKGEKTWKEKVSDWIEQNVDPEMPTNTLGSWPDETSIWGGPLSSGGETTSLSFSSQSRDNLATFDSESLSNSSGEVVHLGLSEDEDIYEYLTAHHAFKKLVVDLQRLIERHYCDKMVLIRCRVLLAARRDSHLASQGPMRHRPAVLFRVDWDLLGFLEEQYSNGIAQDCGSLLAITGDARNAHLSTIHTFLEQTWPAECRTLLEAIQRAVTDPLHVGISNSSMAQVTVNLNQQEVRAVGSEDFLVLVAQQLSWLVATCRPSPAGITYSYVSFTETVPNPGSAPEFQVSCEVISLDNDEPRSCWNALVGNSVIAIGFPIPTRLYNETGLELPLEIMAKLGAAQLATVYLGGYLLKGRLTAMIPVERKHNSVQWHFVHKGGDRIRYSDITALCPVRLSTEHLTEEDCMITRAFLGWCPDIINTLATASFNYSDLGFSNANKSSDKALHVTGGSIGFSFIATGGLSFTVGRDNAPFSVQSQPSYFEDVLDDARQIHVILQDMETRRAWQTNGERIILQMILHRHQLHRFGCGDMVANISAACPDRVDSLREAMLDNAEIDMAETLHMKKAEVKLKTFKDIVGEHFVVLERLEANVENTGSVGMALRKDWRKRVQGYEYMDLVQRKHRIQLKEVELKKTCGQWPEYAQEIGAVILFGANIGEVLLPVQTSGLCPQFRTVPKGRDYLAVEASVLSQLYEENGGDQQQLTSTGTQWHRSKHLFGSCPTFRGHVNMSGSCKCERIQKFVPRSAFGQVRQPGQLPSSGAVIFGQEGYQWLKELSASPVSIRDAAYQRKRIHCTHSPGPLQTEIQGLGYFEETSGGQTSRTRTSHRVAIYQMKNAPIEGTSSLPIHSRRYHPQHSGDGSAISGGLDFDASHQGSSHSSGDTSLRTERTSTTAATDLETLTSSAVGCATTNADSQFDVRDHYKRSLSMQDVTDGLWTASVSSGEAEDDPHMSSNPPQSTAQKFVSPDLGSEKILSKTPIEALARALNANTPRSSCIAARELMLNLERKESSTGLAVKQAENDKGFVHTQSRKETRSSTAHVVPIHDNAEPPTLQPPVMRYSTPYKPRAGKTFRRKSRFSNAKV